MLHAFLNEEYFPSINAWSCPQNLPLDFWFYSHKNISSFMFCFIRNIDIIKTWYKFLLLYKIHPLIKWYIYPIVTVITCYIYLSCNCINSSLTFCSWSNFSNSLYLDLKFWQSFQECFWHNNKSFQPIYIIILLVHSFHQNTIPARILGEWGRAPLLYHHILLLIEINLLFLSSHSSLIMLQYSSEFQFSSN